VLALWEDRCAVVAQPSARLHQRFSQLSWCLNGRKAMSNDPNNGWLCDMIVPSNVLSAKSARGFDPCGIQVLRMLSEEEISGRFFF